MSFFRPRSSSSSSVSSLHAGPAQPGSANTESAGEILLDLMRAASVAELEDAARRLLCVWLSATDIVFTHDATVRHGSASAEAKRETLRFAAPLTAHGA